MVGRRGAMMPGVAMRGRRACVRGTLGGSVICFGRCFAAAGSKSWFFLEAWTPSSDRVLVFGFWPGGPVESGAVVKLGLGAALLSSGFSLHVSVVGMLDLSWTRHCVVFV